MFDRALNTPLGQYIHDHRLNTAICWPEKILYDVTSTKFFPYKANAPSVTDSRNPISYNTLKDELSWKAPLTLFRMGLFGAAHGCGDQKGPLSYNLSHISYNDETWHTYTLPKQEQKSI